MACAFQVSREHLDVRGEPLDGGKLYCYKYGTQEHKVTYSDVDMTSANPWPIILNARGGANVYWDGTPVRFELYARDSGSGEDYFVNSWDKVKGSDGAITEIVHDETLTGSGTETSPLGVDTDVIPTKEYVDDTFATKDELSEHTGDTNNPHQVTAAQVDAYTKTEVEDRLTEERENYGINMKYEATNTLKFYRPTSIILPDPIYELPQTTFAGSSSQVISSGYRLLQGDAYASETNLISWTLFINIISNNSTGPNQYLYEDGGWWTGTTTYYNIQGGRVGSKCVLNDGYNDIYQGTQGVGKIGIRRGSEVDFIEYTSNGKTWIPISSLQISRFGTRTAKMLRFGGNAAGSGLGKGTMSAKLWDESLDDISILF